MSFNGKTTLEKGGKDPPNKSLEYIVNDLLSYFYTIDKYNAAKKAAEDKYDIEKEHDDCWPVDDIKRAWGKTQRTKDQSERRHWSLVIMMQLIERQIRSKEEQSDLMEAGNLVQRCAELSVNDTPDQMKARKRKEIGNDDLRSTGDIDQDFGNPKRKKVHSEDISSQSNADRGDRETIYIRVPFLEMIRNEQHVGQQVRDIRSDYKLIDSVPTGNIFHEIRRRQSYVMSFNRLTRNANWVYEILNGDTTVNNQLTVAQFRNPYQRGHLAAAANHRWCQDASDDANMIDNIVPQHMTLNTGSWKSLEHHCRTTACDPNIRNVHVYTGPLYLRLMNPPLIQGKMVPSHFFKMIIVENRDGTVRELQCHQTPNGNLEEDPDRGLNHEYLSTDYRTTIENIQQNSGLRFIERRPNTQQNAMAHEITVRLHGQNGNRRFHTADIKVTTSPLV